VRRILNMTAVAAAEASALASAAARGSQPASSGR